MITAVDTNVLLDVLHGDRTWGLRSAAALREASQSGSLIACDVVWAETTAALGSAEVEEALTEMGITFDPLDPTASIQAGIAWGRYRARGGRRDRVVPDFMIGAHAKARADQLLTRDRGFFRTYFRPLRVTQP